MSCRNLWPRTARSCHPPSQQILQVNPSSPLCAPNSIELCNSCWAHLSCGSHRDLPAFCDFSVVSDCVLTCASSSTASRSHCVSPQHLLMVHTTLRTVPLMCASYSITSTGCQITYILVLFRVVRQKQSPTSSACSLWCPELKVTSGLADHSWSPHCTTWAFYCFWIPLSI